MNVLVTNDDGFCAWGIETLVKCLSEKHNVFVLAPCSNRSGNSVHINLFTPLEMKKINDAAWTCEGTPADCVNIGLKGDLFNVKIDAVVSGINKGENLGTDIVYSGTCGAAKQAVLCGVPGIAVSMQLFDASKDWDNKDAWHFDSLGKFVSDNLEKLCSLCDVSDKGFMAEKKCVFVNVNAYSFLKFKGVKFTELCFKEYVNDSVEFNNSGGKINVNFLGGPSLFKNRSYSDMEACREGYISVSRVFAEPCCPPMSNNLDSIQFSL